MAEEAEALADGAQPRMRPSYLAIAEQWLKLAADIERSGLSLRGFCLAVLPWEPR